MKSLVTNRPTVCTQFDCLLLGSVGWHTQRIVLSHLSGILCIKFSRTCVFNTTIIVPTLFTGWPQFGGMIIQGLSYTLSKPTPAMFYYVSI